jgi:hypothetical protein
LDLLLDTITNTFGGILFLAILVVILLGNTSNRPQSNTQPLPDLQKLLSQFDEVSKARTALRAEVDSKKHTANLNDPELTKLLREIASDSDLRTKLEKERDELLKSVSDLQAKSAEIASELNKLDAGLEATTTKLSQVKKEIEVEKSARQIDRPFPREHSAVGRRFYSIVLRYDRLYEKRKRDSLGFPGEPNLEDFFVRGMDGEHLVISPKPYRGTPLIEGGKLSPRIESLFEDISADTRYIEIAIWDDSFTGFQALRDFLVKNQYDYRLVVAKEGGDVAEGFVPNPKVQ